MAPADQFRLLSERIAGIENPAQRSNAAIQLFGQSGAELMPLFASGGALDDARAIMRPRLKARGSRSGALQPPKAAATPPTA